MSYCIRKGKTSIILLPEISLTPQIAGRFRSVFGNKVALWHSKLNQQQRSWTWKEICKGTFRVVIGARSAIFSPLKNLGLIVIDSFHMMEYSSLDDYQVQLKRNTKDLKKVLAEAYRILKPGGRFLCLEFSKVDNSGLNFIYKNYSKIIPAIGKFVVGENQPYEYLLKSIENFINQDELIDLMIKKNFKKCTYRNLSGGIVSIHSGWKF